LINISDGNLDQLLNFANDIRIKFTNNKVVLCGIVNAKSGKCSEDCSFCAQSGHHQAEIKTHQLLNKDQLIEAAANSKEAGTDCFSIVTAGKSIKSDEEFNTILETIPQIKDMNKCVSLGALSQAQFKQLKNAGLNKYHHNLETAESFFPQMCTTHNYQERMQTIKNAKAAGLKICCGGIFGIGETPEQRIELAFAIRDLDVESVPLNILHPVEGTRIYEKVEKIRWQDILKLIATFRFILPDKIIGVFGGREENLKEHQNKIFKAGANSILIGDYLTTKGNKIEEDLKMIQNAGLEKEDMLCGQK